MDQIVEAEEPPVLEVLPTLQLPPVAGHVGVSYRGCFVCWGGHYYDRQRIQSYRPADCLYVYPFVLADKYNIWFKVRCEGEFIRSNTSATGAVTNDKLYIFGGLAQDHLQRPVHTNELVIFDLKAGSYTKEDYGGDSGTILPTPRDKCTSWISDDKFFVFGGYGPSPFFLDDSPQSYFHNSQNFYSDEGMRKSWNNQLLHFDLRRREWKEAEQGGSIPSPRAATASCYVADINKVFLFGGRHAGYRLSDLYELSLDSFTWNQIDLSDYCPAGRSWFSFNFIPSRRKLLLFGGLADPSEGDVVFGDAWELDISTYFNNGDVEKKAAANRKIKWRRTPDHLPPRIWHSGVMIGRVNSPQALLIYGGMSKSPDENAFANTLLRLRTSPPSLLVIAARVVAAREKIDLIMRRRAKRLLPPELLGHVHFVKLIGECAQRFDGAQMRRLNTLDADGGAEEMEGGAGLERGNYACAFLKLTQGRCLLYTIFNASDV